ncbi:MAG: hypothetical protein HFI38_08155 [Lachnospiraceae bacterium]|jgi:hypothetical protein|nr:hypothetical protein [Lachnospiraceae bacterium]
MKKHRGWKKFSAMLLGFCLLLSMAGMSLAEDEGPRSDGYTYTITLSAGGKGTFSGAAVIELENISYSAEERINLTSYINQVTLENEKYYVKGFHLSGQEGLVGSVPCTGDAVYVVSYGIRGNVVRYTVNYQDTAGNTLAPSEQFYGNVGDKPVVAFLYLEGYQPQAYNLTKTLSENEAENVFTFTYTPIETEGPPASTAPPEETATSEEAAAGASQAETSPSEAVPEGSDNPDVPPEPSVEDVTDPVVPQGDQEVEDILDLDTPRGAFDSDGDGEADLEGIADAILPLSGMPMAVRLSLSVGILMIVMLVFYLLFGRNRRERKTEAVNTKRIRGKKDE